MFWLCSSCIFQAVLNFIPAKYSVDDYKITTLISAYYFVVYYYNQDINGMQKLEYSKI